MQIGLAYVSIPLAQPGTELQIRVDGGVLVTARVAKLPFYDPANTRQRIGDDARERPENESGRSSAVEAAV
jgi:hypothetical protein